MNRSDSPDVLLGVVYVDDAARVQPTPANLVTSLRALLVLVVAALAFGGGSATGVVAVSAVALLLDAVDGRVARATGTVTAFGARFDMEVDALLLLVLSAYVVPRVGPWVLLVGAARYLLLVASWVWPWLDRPSPPRYWAKVVAAVQGVVLVVVAADVLPPPVEVALLLGALVLLVESFGRQVLWLARHRPGVAEGPFVAEAGSSSSERGRARRRVRGALLTGLAVALVWLALTLPGELVLLRASAFVVLPLEVVVAVALAAVLPPGVRRGAAAAAGLLLGLVLVGRVLDLGFSAALNRPFDPVTDGTYLGYGVAFVRDTLGGPATVLVVLGLGGLLVAVLVLVPWAVLRLTALAAAHRRASLWAGLAAGLVWALCAVVGVQLVPGTPVASAGAATYAWDEVARVPSVLRDQRRFAAAARTDPLRGVPSDRLLTGLRGKDVLFVFVESYGRVAVHGSPFAGSVDRVLRRGTTRLRAAGFGMRSAYLTSPTFGAGSWLAHSTLQSGLWVDGEQRYDVLTSSRRLTLSHAFSRAGWRTVGDVPANTHDWPQGRFYGYDKVYDSRDVGYRGPRFGYPTMPDQFTLARFHRLELGRAARAGGADRRPVMAEIDLISSHFSWATLPRMVPWGAVGDGRVFAGQPEQNPSKSWIYAKDSRVRARYAQSIRYSLRSVIGFLTHLADRDTVVVFLGDHQPNTTVTGAGASHDVPVSVVARDPRVLAAISGWRWQDGLLPSADAPVWRMDAFRDRFLSAYGAPVAPTGAHSRGGPGAR